jgi:hypothetical protein
MTISELKEQVKSILREKMMNEETYKLGSVEYTKKNLTPTDILSLAMAYSQTSGNKMYGGKMEKMIKVANDLAKLNGTTQLDVKKRGNQPALILTLLKNKLVTKDEYISLYKDLLSKQTSAVKALKNADPASRMVGGAAARAAHRDMKGEFDESVNEASSEPQIITQLRDVVKNGYKTLKDPKTGKNMKVDSYSASAITQVYDAINNPSTKDKFVKSGLLGMQSVSFKVVNKK